MTFHAAGKVPLLATAYHHETNTAAVSTCMVELSFPLRLCAFACAVPDVWTQDVLNLGVKPDKLVSLVGCPPT